MEATLNISEMNKEELRQACREAGISYGKLNNDGMREALNKHFANETTTEDYQYEERGTNNEELEVPVVANPFGALLGNVQAPKSNGSTTKVVDGKVVTDAPQAATPAPRARVEKTPAPFVPKVDRKGYHIQKDRPEQNGVKRPSAGTVCEQIWAVFDSTGVVTIARLHEIADSNQWSRVTTSCQYYAWRKFNGIKGRV